MGVSRTALGLVFLSFVTPARAVEIPKPVINIPRPNIPRPNIVVPRPNVTVHVPKPTVNVPRPAVNVAIPKPALHVSKPSINVAAPKPAVAVHVPKPNIATPRASAVSVAKPDLVKPAPAANPPSTPKVDTPKVASPVALPKSEQRSGAVPTDFAPGNATATRDFTPQLVTGGGLKTERTPPPGDPPKATGAPTTALPITSTEQLNTVPPMSETRPPVANLRKGAPTPGDPKSVGSGTTPPPITSTEQLNTVPPRSGTAIVEGGGSRKSGEAPKLGGTAVVEGTAKNGTAPNGASPAVVDGKSAKPGVPNTTTATKDGKSGSQANGSVAKLPEAMSERNAGKTNASKAMQPATAAVNEGNSGPTTTAPSQTSNKTTNYKTQSTNQSWVDAGYSTPDNGAALMNKPAPSNFTYNYNNGSYTWHYFMQNGVMVTYATQNGSNTVVIPVGISTYQPPNTAYKAGMQMSDLGPVTLPTNSALTSQIISVPPPSLSPPVSGTTNTWQPGQSIAHSPDIGLDSPTPVQNTGATTVGNTISNMIQSATVGPPAVAEPLNQPYAQPIGQSPQADNGQPQPAADSGTRGSPLTDDQKQMLKGMDTSNLSPDAQKQFQKLMGATDPAPQGSTGSASSSSSNDPNLDPSKVQKALDDGLNKIDQKYSDMKQQQDQAAANAAADDRRQQLNSACPSGGCQGTADTSTPQKDWSDQGVIKMKEDLAKNTTEVSKNSDNPVNAYVDPKSGGVAAQDSSGKRYWLVPPDPKGR